jgi:dUTP pyrophosphatase
MDVRSNEESTWIEIMEHKVFKTGILIKEIEEGYEVQVRSKSGLAANKAVFVLNSPGTIDNGYRGEVCVILYNNGDDPVYIPKRGKIAQLVICPVVQAEGIPTKSEEVRDSDGFGSTGL